jgi:hypothetical protein
MDHNELLEWYGLSVWELTGAVAENNQALGEFYQVLGRKLFEWICELEKA